MPQYRSIMRDSPGTDADLTRWVIYGVGGGILIGAALQILMPSMGAGFGLSLGMAIGVVGGVIVWVMRRPSG